MLSTTSQADDQTTQQNASTLQEPRSDIQQGGDSSSQTGQGVAPQATLLAPQDQLKLDQLRVGDSNTLITNTTSTPTNLVASHDYLNAAWLWLIVPIVFTILLYWPRRTPRHKSVSAVAPGALAFSPIQSTDIDSQGDTSKKVPSTATESAGRAKKRKNKKKKLKKS